MSDRFERRTRRHQESLEEISRPASEPEPSSSIPVDVEGSWRPIEDKVKSGFFYKVRSADGQMAEAGWRVSRFFNAKTLKWEPQAFWVSYQTGIRLSFEPVEYLSDY